jgi:hypothetical protein
MGGAQSVPAPAPPVELCPQCRRYATLITARCCDAGTRMCERCRRAWLKDGAERCYVCCPEGLRL